VSTKVRWVALLGVVVLTAGAAGCNDSADPVATTPATAVAISTPSTSMTLPAPQGTPILIDTDMAADGIMSMLYLLEHPDLDVLAITVSGTGLVHCEEGVEQALGLLALVGETGIPVACGPEDPLEGINTFPGSWRAVADEGYGLELPPGGQPSDLDAPGLLVSVIGASPEPVVIHADGPNTNLAAAFRAEPSLIDNISMVYVMGGAFETGGNAIKNTDAEWNIWVDPVAADEVLRSGVPVTLLPLDATNQVPLNVFHLQALQAHQSTPAADVVVTMLTGLDSLAAGFLYFWDPLNAAILVDETYAEYESRSVAIVLDDDRSIAGAVVVDGSGSPIRVVTDVDVSRFESEYLSAIAGEDVGPIVIDTDWTGTFDGTSWEFDLPESLASGSYTLQFANRAPGPAVLVFGWLVDDATLEDLDAWDSLEQPPFLELGPTLFAEGRSETVTTVELEGPQSYVVVGLDIDGNEVTTISVVEVS